MSSSDRRPSVAVAVVEALWIAGLLVQWHVFRTGVVPVLATAYEATGRSLSTLLQVGYRSTEWLQAPLVILALVLVPAVWAGPRWTRRLPAAVGLGLVAAQIASAVVFLRTCVELVAVR